MVLCTVARSVHFGYIGLMDEMGMSILLAADRGEKRRGGELTLCIVRDSITMTLGLYRLIFA